MLSTTSLPRICIALGFSHPERLLEHARREAESGERFLEFRLDYLPAPEQGLEVIRRFLQLYPNASVLATCRRHQNHGRFNGSIEDQFKVLHAAVEAGACGVDVEIESAETPLAPRHLLERSAVVIVSYHNYEGTPAMDPVIRRMLKVPATAYKVVTTAKKPSDNLRVLALAKAYPRVPLILLAMSETGFPSRVLSVANGCVYTYAAPSAAEWSFARLGSRIVPSATPSSPVGNSISRSA
mgnify:CR=1 FL=1